jgi:hypothetical protein
MRLTARVQERLVAADLHLKWASPGRSHDALSMVMRMMIVRRVGRAGLAAQLPTRGSDGFDRRAERERRHHGRNRNVRP